MLLMLNMAVFLPIKKHFWLKNVNKNVPTMLGSKVVDSSDVT